MRFVAAVALVFGLIAGTASPAAAQPVQFRGFTTTGSASEVNGQKVLAFGGGVVADLGQPWVSAGAAAEAFTSNGYYAGRGTLFAQVNPFGGRVVRPFVLGGIGFGVYDGPMVGGGIEARGPNTRLGFRVSVEDYIARYNRYGSGSSLPIGRQTGHQVSFKVGVLF